MRAGRVRRHLDAFIRTRVQNFDGRERAARSLAWKFRKPSSRSLARVKIQESQLALTRLRKNCSSLAGELKSTHLTLGEVNLCPWFELIGIPTESVNPTWQFEVRKMAAQDDKNLKIQIFIDNNGLDGLCVYITLVGFFK